MQRKPMRPPGPAFALTIVVIVLIISSAPLTKGDTDEQEAFLGLFIEKNWFEQLEQSQLSVDLIRVFDLELPWTPRDWYKIEVLPDLILVDDGRIEIDDFEISHGKLRFRTWTLRGVAEPIAGEDGSLNLTVTERFSGRQKRFEYLKLSAEQLRKAISVAKERSKTEPNSESGS